MKLTKSLPKSSRVSKHARQTAQRLVAATAEAEGADDEDEGGESEEEPGAEEVAEPEGEAEADADADAEEGGSEEEKPEAAAPQSKVKRLAGVVASAMRSRESLRAEIAQLRAENAELQATLEEVAPRAEAYDELEAEVTRLEAAERSVAQGVRAELEAIGVPEAEAPEASTEGGEESLEDLGARMETEEDPAKRRAIWNEMKAREAKERVA